MTKIIYLNIISYLSYTLIIMKDRTIHIKNPSPKGLAFARGLRARHEAVHKYFRGEISLKELKEAGVKSADPLSRKPS